MSNELATTPAPQASLRDLGRRIVKALTPTENTVDLAIAEGAELLATVARGRVDSGLGVDVAQAPIRTILRGLDALASARDQFQLGHAQLTAIRDESGMGPEELGCSATKRVTGSRRPRLAAT